MIIKMKYKEDQNEEGVFFVPSHTDKSKKYHTSLFQCSCPSFIFHKKDPCKHMKDLIQDIIISYGDLNAFLNRYDINIEFEEGTDGVQMSEQYGETILDKFKSRGMIFEKFGKFYHLKWKRKTVFNQR